MLIGFDLDSTLIDTMSYWKDKMMKVHGLKLKNPRAYMYNDWFLISSKEWDEKGKPYMLDYLINAKPHKYVTDVFKYLEKEGIDYCIVTNRRQPGDTLYTALWFEKNVLNNLDVHVHFKGYHYNNSRDTKLELCKQVGVDVLVDDATFQIEDISRTIPCILYTQPSNIDLERKAYMKFIRIDSFAEFPEALSRLLK